MNEEEFVDVAGVADLKSRRALGARVGDRRIVIYRTDEGFFVTDDSCPHRGGPLSEGELIGNRIICPWHQWEFDVRNGCHPVLPLTVVTHEVKVEAERIYVRLSERPVQMPELL